MMQKRFLLTLITLVLISIFVVLKNNNSDVQAAATFNGTFTTQNQAPDAPFNMSIQDFGPPFTTTFDYFDFPEIGQTAFYTDTHMVFNSTPIPQLNWSQGQDPNGDSVSTLLCISTTIALRDAATPGNAAVNCDVVNHYTSVLKVTPPYTFTALDSRFYYNRLTENITYFVKMTSIEDFAGNLVSPLNYTANITVINTRPRDPTLNVFNGIFNSASFPNSTHSNRPILNWLPDFNNLDADNGTWRDHYPRDNVTYAVNVSTSTQQYLFSSVVDNSQFTGPWTIPLDWGATDLNGVVNKTYNYTIKAFDFVLASVQNLSGVFDLYDYIPFVTGIELTDSGGGPLATSPCPGLCVLHPIANSNVTGLNLNIVTTDLDADCNSITDVNNILGPTNFSSYTHLCVKNSTLPLGNCNESLSNFVLKPNRLFGAPSISQCNFTFLVPLDVNGFIVGTRLAFPSTPQFFVPPAKNAAGFTPLYSLYVNVTSHSGVQRQFANDLGRYSNWSYTELDAVTYRNVTGQNVEEVRLGGGAVTLLTWNAGPDEYNFTNVGNLIVDFLFNASNPCRVGSGCAGLDVWNLVTVPDRFLIDDDSVVDLVDVFGIPYTNLTNPTTRFFNYTTGLQRCVSAACNIPFPTLNETMPTHYHINPPNLNPGTYRSLIYYQLVSSSRNQHI